MTDALILARAQFAFTMAFHIIFPSFTIGLASYLAVLEAMWLRTEKAVYINLFRYWLKIFAVVFGSGVVSGLVMSYQFGSNWSVFSDKAGAIIGPLMAYEVMSAFFLEAGFLGVMLFGLERVGKPLHFTATLAVAVGTLTSAFWILAANSWMQTPAGFAVNGQGQFVPVDWLKVIFNPSFLPRLIHMVLAAYLTTALTVGAVGAYHFLKARKAKTAASAEVRTMFSMAMWMATLVAPIQILAGDTLGINSEEHQPAKIMAVEGHYRTYARGAPLVLFGLPDDRRGRVDDDIEVPKLSSLILEHNLDAPMTGLATIPRADWPPVAIVFWSFRIMVGLGFLMALLGLLALIARLRRRLDDAPWVHRLAVAMGPAGFISVIAGWVTSEVGRQPFSVYGLLLTSQAASPLQAPAVAASLAAFAVVYFVVFGSGVFYLLRLMHRPPTASEHGIEEHGPIRAAGFTPAPALDPDAALGPAR
jgi:cytochrome bd ubiquinol oxidase subunit I